jgi:Rod binding domain-containing protein
MFLSQMMSHMFEGIETDPNFGGGHGETMFRSMLVDQYAQKMTNAGGVGIADAVTREILKTQGA